MSRPDTTTISSGRMYITSSKKIARRKAVTAVSNAPYSVRDSTVAFTAPRKQQFSLFFSWVKEKNAP